MSTASDYRDRERRRTSARIRRATSQEKEENKTTGQLLLEMVEAELLGQNGLRVYSLLNDGGEQLTMRIVSVNAVDPSTAKRWVWRYLITRHAPKLIVILTFKQSADDRAMSDERFTMFSVSYRVI